MFIKCTTHCWVNKTVTNRNSFLAKYSQLLNHACPTSCVVIRTCVIPCPFWTRESHTSAICSLVPWTFLVSHNFSLVCGSPTYTLFWFYRVNFEINPKKIFTFQVRHKTTTLCCRSLRAVTPFRRFKFKCNTYLCLEPVRKPGPRIKSL